MINTLPLIFFAVIFNVAAQLLLKAGMDKLGYFNISWANVLPVSFKLMSNPFVIGGFSCYIFSAIIWLIVLSRTEVSVAYPLISIGYILNAIAAYYLFGEALSFTRITGIIVIMIGVYLIART
jgi:multidrug transporter EmrE-like cation transporter